ncbi:MAG: sulfurtransferase [Alphaproteobacteria bacterium]|nr:sulfurtransferase [Alphaproteobacteria bacterium]
MTAANGGAEPPLQIDVAELAALKANGAPHRVLDVREPWERDLCKIAGSIDIPLSEIPERIDEVRGGEGPLVVICHHGMRSLNATVWLRGQGVAVAINLKGGIDAWARQIDPTLKLY